MPAYQRPSLARYTTQRSQRVTRSGVPASASAGASSWSRKVAAGVDVGTPQPVVTRTTAVTARARQPNAAPRYNQTVSPTTGGLAVPAMAGDAVVSGSSVTVAALSQVSEEETTARTSSAESLACPAAMSPADASSC